jgi:hypothetical protein
MKYEIYKNNILIADNAKLYKNFVCKVKGLMFSKPLRKGRGIILEAEKEGILDTTIHMLFVFFPIDIIWLNSNKEVVDIKRSILPFIPWISPKKASKYVIELAKGASKSIRIGDILNFKAITC